MEIARDEKHLLNEPPVNGVVKKDGVKYITELDESKTQIIDRYRVGRQIGKGGFAVVYELTSVKTGKMFAGKVVDKNGLVKPKVIDKFNSEIRIHKTLDHRHVCKMYKHFEDNRYHYLILELCSNDTLGHIVKSRKSLTEPEAQYFLIQIIEAVRYLHSRCIIHRDLKLGNVFLDDNLEVKVGDLGLAAQLNEPNERKKTMCGTPNYIAPEILLSSDKRAYSYEVDTWAIGVITYTMLIGKAPFDGGNVNTTYENIRQNEFSFPIKEQHISHQARMFIRSILTKDPASRLTLDQMLQHPFFTDSPIAPPKSLPLYILKQPYLLTTRAVTEPTPVIQRVQREQCEHETTIDTTSKRVRMGDLHVSPPISTPSTQPVQPVQPALSNTIGNNQRCPPAEYDYDGNGRNNLNRFSLSAHRSKGMEERIDLANRSFHDTHGLLPQETFEGLPEGIVPSVSVVRSRYQNRSGAALLMEHAANLHTAMHHPRLMKPADHVQVKRTSTWVVDEYDFTRKYGIGYMFSNGIIGILFNDKTSIVISTDGMFFEYHTRISIQQWNIDQLFTPDISGHIDDYPEELSKKITLIKYFRTNFLERMVNREITKEEIEDAAKGGPTQHMPFAVKWLVKDTASICMLSTGAVQIRYEGGTILNLESPFDDITFLDKFGVVSAMPLAKAVGSGRDDIHRRLDYITNSISDIVTRLSKTK